MLFVIFTLDDSSNLPIRPNTLEIVEVCNGNGANTISTAIEKYSALINHSSAVTGTECIANDRRIFMIGLDANALAALETASIEPITAETAELTAPQVQYLLSNIETMPYALSSFLHKHLFETTKNRPVLCSQCGKSSKLFSGILGGRYCSTCWPRYLKTTKRSTSSEHIPMSSLEYVVSIAEGECDPALFTDEEAVTITNYWSSARQDNWFSLMSGVIDSYERNAHERDPRFFASKVW